MGNRSPTSSAVEAGDCRFVFGHDLFACKTIKSQRSTVSCITQRGASSSIGPQYAPQKVYRSSGSEVGRERDPNVFRQSENDCNGLKMHGIATARQHERTREAELRMIHAVAPSLTVDAKTEDSAHPAGVHWTIYCNESPGAELAQVYPYLELVTA